jgi:hypothetical protein
VDSGTHERALLACLLMECDDSEVVEELFTTSEHLAVFRAIRTVKLRGGKVDAESVRMELNGSVRPLEFSTILDAAETSLHFKEYLSGCRKALALRERKRLAFIINDQSTSLDELRGSFRKIVSLETGNQSHHIESQLKRRRYDPKKTPPEARVIYKLAGRTIATAGNIEVLAAKAKAGKTAFLGAMIASATGRPGETLSVASSNPNNHGLILFDTEQSEADFYRVMALAFKRVNCEPPPWLMAYSVVPLTIKDRNQAIVWALERAKREFGGVHSVFLDGVADFVADPNDAEECFTFVAELHRNAIAYDTAIECVLHFNPGEYLKTRGHLGSQLERKAEVNLALDKSADGVTSVYTTTSRRAPIFKGTGPRFQWSEAFGLHVTVPKDGRAASHTDESSPF